MKDCIKIQISGNKAVYREIARARLTTKPWFLSLEGWLGHRHSWVTLGKTPGLCWLFRHTLKMTKVTYSSGQLNAELINDHEGSWNTRPIDMQGMIIVIMGLVNYYFKHQCWKKHSTCCFRWGKPPELWKWKMVEMFSIYAENNLFFFASHNQPETLQWHNPWYVRKTVCNWVFCVSRWTVGTFTITHSGN